MMRVDRCRDMDKLINFSEISEEVMDKFR